MPIRALSFFALAIALHGGAAHAQDGASLPDGAEFRSRMLSWRGDPPAAQDEVPTIATAVPIPLISSAFGARRDPMHGGRGWHAGIDIPGPPGSAVTASAPGVVLRAGPAGGYGKMVEIDHGNGLRTRYAHLSHIAVQPGDHLLSGQLIGRMGSTGRSTGPHLHFEVRRNGTAVDPRDYLAGPLR